MYYLYFVITARYLDYRDEAEYFQYLKRAAANPIILSVAGDLRKLYAIGDLGDYYKRNNRLKDAQVLFKHIVDSNAVPADLFRFYLAESYTLAKEYESAKEILHSLYCKRVFEADTELMSIFEEYNKVCLREAVYDILTRVTANLLDIANGIKDKGVAYFSYITLPYVSHVCIQRPMSNTVSLWRSVTRLLIYVQTIVTSIIYGFLFSCFYWTAAMPYPSP